uniref:YhcG N-terminal domain-containing protein n=1 Tax=Prevotella sp. GTC17260 TaxID=3236796 RepID=A0AB33JFB2_9BACT
MERNVITNQDLQFDEVVSIIRQHRSKASQTVNEEMLLAAWHIGGYVSSKLKSEEWGSKVVSQLSEFIRSHHLTLKVIAEEAFITWCCFMMSIRLRLSKVQCKTIFAKNLCSLWLDQ